MSNYDSWKTRSDRDDPAAQNHEPPADDERGDEFSVVQFFEGGAYEYVRRGVSAQEAVQAAHHYTHNVAAALLGITERVIITDGGDYCVFEWKKGEGVSFPPECRGRQ